MRHVLGDTRLVLYCIALSRVPLFYPRAPRNIFHSSNYSFNHINMNHSLLITIVRLVYLIDDINNSTLRSSCHCHRHDTDDKKRLPGISKAVNLSLNALP